MRLTLLLLALANIVSAASIQVHLRREGEKARANEPIVCSWDEISRALPDVEPDHLIVRDPAGNTVPYQFTNLKPLEPKGVYNDVIFGASFAEGERELVYTITAAEKPQGPFPAVVFARYVPERLDDFAWENDRMAHRMYGPGLNTDAAGKSKMRSSGLDFWAKRVSYPIVDRWYLRGHDHYHIDQGEGLDFYSVGTGCGVGGTGVWDGSTLATAGNWAAWKVLANGPIRAIFEMGYDAFPTASGTCSEVRRFSVDAGRNVDLIESTFTFSDGGEHVVAIGLSKHKNARARVEKDQKQGTLVLWEDYEKPDEAGLGTAVIVEDGACVGFAEDALNYLILVKAKSGVPVRYWAGGGWSRSLQQFDSAKWSALIADYAAQLRDPISVSVRSRR